MRKGEHFKTSDFLLSADFSKYFPPSGPPDYQDLPPLTPRCSRHSAQAQRASKEELAMVNINNFPSVGDLREPAGQLGQFGYSSVERLLPPYPSYSRSAHYHRSEL